MAGSPRRASVHRIGDMEASGARTRAQVAVSATEHVRSDPDRGSEVNGVDAAQCVFGSEVAGETHQRFIDRDDGKLRPQKFEAGHS